MSAASHELSRDADDAVRLVSGTVRKGETGEAFRERRRVVSWSATEAGLVSPSVSEERGTAMRLRRGKETLLVAREGDGPDALRAAVREAARRTGNSPFFKPRAGAARRPEPHDAPAPLPDESEAALLASALSRAVADPRGLSLSLVLSRVDVARAVVTPRALLFCGALTRLSVTGTIRRRDGQRTFAFDSSRPLPAAADAFSRALSEATRPAPRVAPPEGETDVVFSPSAATVFWHETVGHALEAEGAEGASVLARVPGAAIAPKELEVYDDPTRTDLPGGYLHDDEGVAPEPTPLIEEGCVAGLLTDRRAAGADSNGHGRTADFRRPPRARMSNLVVPPGRASLEELVAACGTGVFVREISSGSADAESGRFALVVEAADAIRRGKLAGPSARFVLTGEILAALRNLDGELGQHAYPASGLGLCVKFGDAVPVGGAAPAMLVRSLRVSALSG